MNRMDQDDFDKGKKNKEAKAERKRRQRKDQSQYRISDQNQKKKQSANAIGQSFPGEKKGRVIAVKSEEIDVQCDDTLYCCTMRGTLKQHSQRVKNLVVIGDWVSFVEQPSSLQQRKGAILFVHPRSSVLSRADHLSQKREHAIAANVDQVIITLSVVSPKLNVHLADRYILAARKGNIAPILVVNKADLLESNREEKLVWDAFFSAYSPLSIPLFLVSAKTGVGLDALQKYLCNAISVFSGQSGVGKSSLINHLTEYNQVVAKQVSKTGKGMHATTHSSLIPFQNNGWCIDTPGVRSFAPWNPSLDEIRTYFEDIAAIGLQCRYNDCLHREEPDCAVRNAVEAGTLASLRYQSYLALLESTQTKHRRR